MGLLPQHNCENCQYTTAGLGCEDSRADSDPKWWQYPRCPGFKAKTPEPALLGVIRPTPSGRLKDKGFKAK